MAPNPVILSAAVRFFTCPSPKSNVTFVVVAAASVATNVKLTLKGTVPFKALSAVKLKQIGPEELVTVAAVVGVGVKVRLAAGVASKDAAVGVGVKREDAVELWTRAKVGVGVIEVFVEVPAIVMFAGTVFDRTF